MRRNSLIRMMISAIGKDQIKNINIIVKNMNDDDVNYHHKQMCLSAKRGLSKKEAEDILMRYEITSVS